MARLEIGIFKIIGLIGLLAKELGDAANDGKITFAEGVSIIKAICEQLGIDFEDEGIEL